jgi:hypothetical protein
MRLGSYIFSGIVFIAIVAGAAYMAQSGYFSLTILGVTLNLPIAVWMILPLVLFFILTILHMMYHGTLGYFRRRKWIRDADELKDALYWGLLKEPKEHNFSIPEMKESAPLLNVSALEVAGSVQGLSDKLMKTLEWVKKIENGEYVDLKARKVERFLSMNNPLLVRNHINRMKHETAFAEKVLQGRESYDNGVVEAAMEQLVRKEDFYKLKRYASSLGKEHFFILLDRVDGKEDIGFSPEMAEAFMEPLDLECQDYLRILKTTLRRFTPDQNLALFKKLSKESEKARNAYLYLLFEYEMMDNVKRFLEEYDEQEFKAFRAFFILKRGKYHFKIDELIDTAVACNDA